MITILLIIGKPIKNTSLLHFYDRLKKNKQTNKNKNKYVCVCPYAHMFVQVVSSGKKDKNENTYCPHIFANAKTATVGKKKQGKKLTSGCACKCTCVGSEKGTML